jgi:SAM-dependent methyltransferase
MAATVARADLYKWVPQGCPICGDVPRKYLGYRGGEFHRSNLGVATTIWRCKSCDLIYPDPMPVPIGGIGQHYSEDPAEYFKIHVFEQKLERAEKLIREAESLVNIGRLLDIGSGQGAIALTAQRLGWNVTCVEPSPSFAVSLRERGLDVQENTLENLSLPECSFDAVILSAVLEHLYNPNQVLAIISRLLKPDGILFLDVPNERGLYYRIGNLYCWLRGSKAVQNLSPTFSPYHVFGFGKKALTKILAKHKLTAEVTRFYGGNSSLPTSDLWSKIEFHAIQLVSDMSIGDMGNYIELWARKL